jgi:hypothetical protein
MRAKSGKVVLLSIPFLLTKGINMAILGISTNTRLLGLAIIHQGRLLDYSIRLDKSPWSPSKANKIITSLEPCVRQYCIKKAILSMPYEYHQTAAFKSLMQAFETFFKENDIAFSTQTPEAVYSFCEQKEKKSKKEVLYAITTLYPQLTYCFQREMKNKKKYYTKLFEAVAVATLGE